MDMSFRTKERKIRNMELTVGRSGLRNGVYMYHLRLIEGTNHRLGLRCRPTNGGTDRQTHIYDPI